MSVSLFCGLMIAGMALAFWGILLSIRFGLKGRVSPESLTRLQFWALGVLSLLGVGALGVLTGQPVTEPLLLLSLGLAGISLAEKMILPFRLMLLLAVTMLGSGVLFGMSFWAITAAFVWLGTMALMMRCDKVAGLGIFLPLAWTFGVWMLAEAPVVSPVFYALSLLFWGVLLVIYQLNKMILGSGHLSPAVAAFVGYFYGLFMAAMWASGGFLPLMGWVAYPVFELTLTAFSGAGSSFLLTRALAKAARPMAVWWTLFVRVVLLICLGIFAMRQPVTQAPAFLIGMLLVLIEMYQRLSHWGEPKVGYRALWGDIKGGILTLKSAAQDLKAKKSASTPHHKREKTRP